MTWTKNIAEKANKIYSAAGWRKENTAAKVVFKKEYQVINEYR